MYVKELSFMELLPEIRDVMEEYKEMQFMYRSALKTLKARLDILNDEFQYIHNYNPVEIIKTRVKTEESIIRKLQMKGLSITLEHIKREIDDIAGVRVICTYTSDIYRIVDMLSRQQDIEIMRVKDYYLDPKPSGYRSYHMIVAVPIYLTERPVKVKVEVQVCTRAMDTWANLENKVFYQYEGQPPIHLRKELRECADMIYYLDTKLLEIKEDIDEV